MADYNKLKLEDLQTLARERGFAVSGLHKPQLIKALKEDDKEQAKTSDVVEEEPQEEPEAVVEEFEPPLNEQFKERQEFYGRLLGVDREELKGRVEKKEQEVVSPYRPWVQNTVLDTTGLGGESDPSKAYNVPELKAKDRYGK